MKISRLDLDGAGSPAALVARILDVEPDLPIPVPLTELCERLDITRIDELHTAGFEAALITDTLRSTGAILVATHQGAQRRRFSIGHELGHFLIAGHDVPPGGFLCSADQLRLLDTADRDRRRRMEAQANRFAALLLMPLPLLRAELRSMRSPDVSDIIQLATQFDVSKEAMARAYVEAHRQAVAVLVLRHGKVLRSYRGTDSFPWIDVGLGAAVPAASIAREHDLQPGEASSSEECEPELWLDGRGARRVEVMTEQVLAQGSGCALLLLHAELRDDE